MTVSVSRIIRLVHEGKLTPHQGALLLEMRLAIARARQSQALRRALLDLVTLGPVRRWIIG